MKLRKFTSLIIKGCIVLIALYPTMNWINIIYEAHIQQEETSPFILGMSFGVLFTSMSITAILALDGNLPSNDHATST